VTAFCYTHSMKKKIFESLGWYGVVAILIAFALVSFDYIGAQSFWFQFLNLTGSVGIAIDAFYNKDKPAAFLNVAYALIALVVLLKIFLKV
jgi:hypothetical protein